MITSFQNSFRHCLVISMSFAGFAGPVCAQEKTTFTDHVLPLVEQHCAKCHNPDKKKGDLDLTSYSGVMKGGGTGALVTPGNPDSSKLIKALTHEEEPNMPPNKPPLPEKELAVFKNWIIGGLLERAGSKAVAAKKPSVDLTLKVSDAGKPDGPPPMPKELSIEPVVHTARPYAINGLAASPWAPLAAITGQKQVLLYNTSTLELLGILPFPDGQPWDLKFSRSGKLLLAGGGHGAKSGKALLWNIETGELITTIGNEYDSVLATDISPDQTKVALGGPDRLVKIFSTKSGELEHKIKKHTDWVTALAFSPNGEMLASADRNGGLTVWDADNGQELFTTAGHKGAVTALSWRSDSKLIASSSEDGTVKLWESSEGRQAKTWNAHAGGALSVAYSRNGQFVTCGRDGAVVTWKSDGTKLKACDFFGEMALRCVWSHDGSNVLASDFAGRVGLWDAHSGKRLADFDSNPAPIEERIATIQKRIVEIQSRGDKPSPELETAEARRVKLNAELASVKSVAEKTAAEFATRAKEVVRLKELVANSAPSVAVEDQLAAARAAREALREPRNTAISQAERLTQAVAAAQQKVDQLKGNQSPEVELAAANSKLQRLMVARSFAALRHTVMSKAEMQREVESLKADIASKQGSLKELSEQLAQAKDSATRTTANATIKSTTAELKSAETRLKQATVELTIEQAKLDKLSAEHERTKAASAPGQRSQL